MKKLFLDLNHIGPQGAVAISEAIAGMSGLQKLCLENNDIGDEGAKAMADALQDNSAMIALYLENNTVEPDLMSDILTQLKNLDNV